MRSCTMLRAAQQNAGDDVGIVFTEMLPGAGDAWVPDANGQRYFSELRIQLRDTMAARSSPPGAARDDHDRPDTL